MKIASDVVVLGANGLIGGNLAIALIGLGVVPICVDIAAAPKPEIARAAGEANREIAYIQANVCVEAEVLTLAATFKSERPNALAVVNAAYPRLPGFGRSPLTQDCETFSANLALHVSAYFNVFKIFGNYFSERQGGRVISFSSIYGFFLARPELYEGTEMGISAEYVACKAAILQLNAYYAKLHRAKGVLFNCISPGGLADKQPPIFVERYGRHTTSTGLLDAGEVVNSILFLLSDMSTSITGQNLVVDGGFTL